MHIEVIEPLGISKGELDAVTAPLREEGHTVKEAAAKPASPEEIVGRATDAEILMTANHPVPGEVIRRLPGLRMLSIAFTGYDHVDIDACRERGVAVTNAAGYATEATAEMTLLLMLGVLRKVLPCDAATRSGLTRTGLIGRELKGKTVGIIGTGAIGTRVAELVHAFGAEILAWSRTEKDTLKELGGRYVPMDTLLAESDIVTPHVPLNETTRGLLGSEELKKVKEGAVVVNAARGPIIDTDALVAALEGGRVAGAGIDVFETEPPIDLSHPLLNAPNVLVAPHVGFATREALLDRAERSFGNIEAWLRGEERNRIV